jgi:hypothetical protein
MSFKRRFHDPTHRPALKNFRLRENGRSHAGGRNLTLCRHEASGCTEGTWLGMRAAHCCIGNDAVALLREMRIDTRRSRVRPRRN